MKYRLRQALSALLVFSMVAGGSNVQMLTAYADALESAQSVEAAVSDHDGDTGADHASAGSSESSDNAAGSGAESSYDSAGSGTGSGSESTGGSESSQDSSSHGISAGNESHDGGAENNGHESGSAGGDQQGSERTEGSGYSEASASSGMESGSEGHNGTEGAAEHSGSETASSERGSSEGAGSESGSEGSATHDSGHTESGTGSAETGSEYTDSETADGSNPNAGTISSDTGSEMSDTAEDGASGSGEEGSSAGGAGGSGEAAGIGTPDVAETEALAENAELQEVQEVDPELEVNAAKLSEREDRLYKNIRAEIVGGDAFDVETYDEEESTEPEIRVIGRLPEGAYAVAYREDPETVDGLDGGQFALESYDITIYDKTDTSYDVLPEEPLMVEIITPEISKATELDAPLYTWYQSAKDESPEQVIRADRTLDKDTFFSETADGDFIDLEDLIRSSIEAQAAEEEISWEELGYAVYSRDKVKGKTASPSDYEEDDEPGEVTDFSGVVDEASAEIISDIESSLDKIRLSKDAYHFEYTAFGIYSIATDDARLLPLTEQKLEAVIYTGADYSEESSEETTITLTGLLPTGGTVRAYPVELDVADGIVLAAYDISIFRADGTLWEPKEDNEILVEIDTPALREAMAEDRQFGVLHVTEGTDLSTAEIIPISNALSAVETSEKYALLQAAAEEEYLRSSEASISRRQEAETEELVSTLSVSETLTTESILDPGLAVRDKKLARTALGAVVSGSLRKMNAAAPMTAGAALGAEAASDEQNADQGTSVDSHNAASDERKGEASAAANRKNIPVSDRIDIEAMYRGHEKMEDLPPSVSDALDQAIFVKEAPIGFYAKTFSVYAIVETILQKTITASDGLSYRITVSYDSRAGFPADAEIRAYEISTDDTDALRGYLQDTADTLGVELSSMTYARLFDISIVDSAGTEYQPDENVSVTIELLEKEAEGVESLRVVHFGEEEGPAELDASTEASKDGAAVTFDTDGFSAFSLTDFSLTSHIINAIFGDRKLYENDDIILTGRMPLLGTVEATPVEVTIENEDVLVAYDIKIYANSLMKLLGISWQPSGDAIKVTVKSDVLGDGKQLKVFHMKDENDEPEFIASVNSVESTAEFEAQSFSIYPIGEDPENARIGYRFWYNDGSQNILLSTQYFRYKDVHPATGDGLTISEPSIPDMDSSTWTRIFKGWGRTSFNDSDENLTTIPELNTELVGKQEDSFVEGTYIDLYANLKNVYYVTYVDVNPNNVLATEIIPKADSGDTTFTIKSESELRPTIDSDRRLNGWCEVSDPTTVYEPGQANVVISENITLYPSIEGGHWLIFNDNDLVDDGSGKLVSGGADFTPPAFYLGDAVTVRPPDPTWAGYEFGGWYTDAECETEFVFGSTLSADTTVYAKWTPSDSTYRVIIWKQRSSDAVGLEDSAKTYDYITSYLYDDVVTGQTVTLRDEYKRIYGSSGTSTDTDKAYFTYNNENTDQSTIVKADGSSVLNVYYDRVPVTLNYYTYQYTYTPTTSNNGTQYGFYNDEYVPIYRDGNTWYRTREWNWGWEYRDPYDGTRYIRSNSRSWQLYKSFIGLYGSTLEGNDYIWPSEYDWYSEGYNYGGVGGTRTTFMASFLPTDNQTTVAFYGSTPSGSAQIHFLLQNEDGTYTEKEVVSANGGNFYISDKYIGYHASQYRADNGSWRDAGEKNSSGYYNNGNAVPYSNNLYIRFDRTNYDLTFYTNNGANILDTITIPFGTSLSSYEEHNPGQRTGYYFLGWYADPSCSEAFDFNQTMPDTNMAVYGKWKMRRVRVVIEPGADNVSMGSQATTFRLNFDERIDGGLMETAQRAGYILDGWYTDPEFQHRYLFSSPVNDDTLDVAWNYQEAQWTATRVAYGDDDEDHDNVRGILHIYAKWILDTSSTGYNVIYDPGDAAIYDSLGRLLTTVPVDPHMYGFDGTATAREAPSGYNDLYEFKYWEATKENGDVMAIHPSEPIPLSELMPSETIYDDNGDVLRYTVTLRAVYDLIGDPTKLTTITYEGNTFSAELYNGSTVELKGKTKDGTYRQTITLDKEVNQTIKLPMAEDFFLDGWTLVGWAFTSGTYEAQTGEGAYEVRFEPGQEVAADNLIVDSTNDEGNTLYAMWLPKEYSVTVRQVIETGVPDHNFAYAYKRGAEQDISAATETVKSLTGNSSFVEEEFKYYDFFGDVIRIKTPTVPDDAIYSVRVNAVVTRDDGTVETLNPTAAGNYQILGDVVITYTYSLKVPLKLQKRDSTDHSKELTGAKFILTPVEYNPSTNHWDVVGSGITVTVDEGTHTEYVQEGTYRITESEAPQDYAKISTELYLTIHETGVFDLFSASGGHIDEKIAELTGDSEDESRILTVYDRPIRTVTLSKVVEGKDGVFAFKITVFEEDDSRLGSYKIGEYNDTELITSNIGELTINLSHGDRVELKIPYGCKLTVEETRYKVYETSYVWNGETAVESSVFGSTPVEITADSALTFTNKHIPAPTGYASRKRTFGGLLLMSMLLGSMAALPVWYRKRRNGGGDDEM